MTITDTFGLRRWRALARFLRTLLRTIRVEARAVEKPLVPQRHLNLYWATEDAFLCVDRLSECACSIWWSVRRELTESRRDDPELRRRVASLLRRTLQIFDAVRRYVTPLRPLPHSERTLGIRESVHRFWVEAEAGWTGSPISREEEFQGLVRVWKLDTRSWSSTKRMAKHPAYRQIVSMGKPAIPLLLEELQREPDFWFAALREITGENPVPPQAAGKIEEMARSWIAWGKSQGYLQ
ncbi:MAG: hypothetical protein L0Z62_25670 [Gemmataceae bacterium]|nr:hypothetical protein [Gemmataceae bacterium]